MAMAKRAGKKTGKLSSWGWAYPSLQLSIYIYVMIIMYITVYVDDLYNYNLKGMVSYS